MGFWKEERGAASLMALGILGLLSVLGAAAFTVTRHHFDTVRLFSDGVVLRQEAQNGIVAAADRVAADSALRDTIPGGQWDPSLSLLSYQGPEGTEVEGTVYARRQGDQILLLSVSRRQEARSQVMAYMEEREGRWRIAHWEH